jgi:hypothetical protein
MRIFKNYFQQQVLQLIVALLCSHAISAKMMTQQPQGQLQPSYAKASDFAKASSYAEATKDRSSDKMEGRPKPIAANAEIKPVKMQQQAPGEIQQQKGADLVREKSLAHIQKVEEKRAGIDNRSLQEIQDLTGPDNYTQTEAYLQQSKLRELVTTEFKHDFEIVRHMGVISRVLAKEAELRKTHRVFYHGIINEWTVWQDTLTKLSNHFNASAKKSGEFIFLRTKGGGVDEPTKEFLISQLQANGLVDDNNETRGLLLSTNFSPFGNTGFEGESTWRFFIHAHSHTEPSKEMYEKIMDEFGLSYTYIKELMDLVPMLRSKHEALLQIFIPKTIVDDTAYLAWVTGVPAHDEIISWVRTNVKNKKYTSGGGKTGEMRALESLKKNFKKEQEKNKTFRDLLETIEKGDYSVNGYLNIYCNKPWELPDLNYSQARLILTNDMLLNPQSGIEMFRYNEIDHKLQEQYEERLDQIIKKIIAAKK